MCSGALGAPAVRISLRGIAEVLVGRGPERAIRVLERDGRRMIAIALDDGWMSAQHFRLVGVIDGGWNLADAGSKNGTAVNGVRRPGGALADGDVIDAGRTVFVFRAAAPVSPHHAELREVAAEASRAATISGRNRAVLDQLGQVAKYNVPILLTGESGVGKEVAARLVHEQSGRTGPFVAVNCGGLSPTVIERELFGHCRGAFSGATSDHDGWIRAADGGTLFLDEVGDLPATGQTALLRALQEREVVPLGGVTPVAVDFRVVAATNADLRARIEAGVFRRDLYARLGGRELALLPLRERKEDLGLLVAALLGDRGPRRIAHAGARALFLHDWPYNVRELGQVLAACAAVTDGDEIPADILIEQLALRSGREPAGASAVRAGGRARPGDARKLELLGLLERFDGNLAAVARVMATSRSQVRRLARRFGIDPARFRS
jgi:DNA-binding NtrC family response regulator